MATTTLDRTVLPPAAGLSLAAAGIMVAECRAAAILVRERIPKSVGTDRSARFERAG